MGDVDGDGDFDIIAGDSLGDLDILRGVNRIWINGGDSSGNNIGIFTDSGQELGRLSTQSIALGDIDGDSDLDIVTVDFGASFAFSNTSNIWLNSLKSPSAAFIIDSGQTLGDKRTDLIALSDIDGDGDLDIIAGNFDDNRVWINEDAGVFTDSNQIFSKEFTTSIIQNGAIVDGDIDGDGDLDMVIIRFGVGIINILLNGGDNSGSNTEVFTDSGQELSTPPFITSIALGDIDADGDLDIISGNMTNRDIADGTLNQNHIWINGGDNSGSNTGMFTGSLLFDYSDTQFGNSDTLSITLGDIDGDGDLDIITGNNGANRVWLNDF